MVIPLSFCFKRPDTSKINFPDITVVIGYIITHIRGLGFIHLTGLCNIIWIAGFSVKRQLYTHLAIKLKLTSQGDEVIVIN